MGLFCTLQDASSTPGSWTLHVSNTPTPPSSYDHQKCVQTLINPQGQNHTHLRTSAPLIFFIHSLLYLNEGDLWYGRRPSNFHRPIFSHLRGSGTFIIMCVSLFFFTCLVNCLHHLTESWSHWSRWAGTSCPSNEGHTEHVGKSFPRARSIMLEGWVRIL